MTFIVCFINYKRTNFDSRCISRQLVLGGVRGGDAGGRGDPSGLGAALRQPAGAAGVRQVRVFLAQSERDQVRSLLWTPHYTRTFPCVVFVFTNLSYLINIAPKAGTC